MDEVRNFAHGGGPVVNVTIWAQMEGDRAIPVGTMILTDDDAVALPDESEADWLWRQLTT